MSRQRAARKFSRLEEVSESYGTEDADDRQHDQQFDEGETAVLGPHAKLFHHNLRIWNFYYSLVRLLYKL